MRISFLNHRILAFTWQIPEPSICPWVSPEEITAPPSSPLHHLQMLSANIFSSISLYDIEWHMGTSLSDTHDLKHILTPILPDSFDNRKFGWTGRGSGAGEACFNLWRVSARKRCFLSSKNVELISWKLHKHTDGWARITPIWPNRNLRLREVDW